MFGDIHQARQSILIQAHVGQRALELGLIDGLGECRQTLLQRFGDDTDVMLVEPKRKFLPLGLPAINSHLVQETADLAIERAYFSRFGL